MAQESVVPLLQAMVYGGTPPSIQTAACPEGRPQNEWRITSTVAVRAHACAVRRRLRSRVKGRFMGGGSVHAHTRVGRGSLVG